MSEPQCFLINGLHVKADLVKNGNLFSAAFVKHSGPVSKMTYPLKKVTIDLYVHDDVNLDGIQEIFVAGINKFEGEAKK